MLVNRQNLSILIITCIFIITTITLGSLYGISQFNLNKTRGELSVTKRELQDAQRNLNDAKTQLAASEAQLLSTQTQLKSTQEILNETKSLLTSTQNKLSMTENDLTKLNRVMPISGNEVDLAKSTVTAFLGYAQSANTDSMYYLCHPDCQARFHNDLFIFRNQNGISAIEDTLKLNSFTMNPPQFAESWRDYNNVFIFQVDAIYKKNAFGSIFDSLFGSNLPSEQSASITIYCIKSDNNDWRIYF
jgi:hypothetical protein